MSYKSYCLLALFCVIGTACSTTAPTGKILFDDPRGTVSLQTTSDPSIQATQPVNLEPALLAQVLKGIEVQYKEHGLQSLISGPLDSRPRVLGRSNPVPRSAACRRLTYGSAGSACRISCPDDIRRFHAGIIDDGNDQRVPLCLWPTVVRDSLSIPLFTDADEPEHSGRQRIQIEAPRFNRPEGPYCPVYSEGRSTVRHD